VSVRYRTLGLTVPVTEALDPQLWRERYAHGLFLGSSPASAPSGSGSLADRLCAGQGTPKTGAIKALQDSQAALSAVVTEISDDVIRWFLRVALSELEVKLGIPMGIITVKSLPVDDGLVQGRDYDRAEPRRPFTRSDQGNWFRIDLPPNVISVERVRAYWFDSLVWEISPANNNEQLFKLEWPRIGSGHILPTVMANLFIQGTSYGALNLHNSFQTPLPDVWGVDYTCGPVDHYLGQPAQIEAVLAHWVYCAAGILLLAEGGLARSQGLTSASVSIDGLSRSIGLQASGVTGLYGALSDAYERTMERIDWKALKLYKAPPRLVPYGH
jgi:hypothetical protein